MYISKRVKSTTLSCGCCCNRLVVNYLWDFNSPSKYCVFQKAHINRLANQDSLFKTESINFTLTPNKISWFNSSENSTNNIVEQDYRMIKWRILLGLGFK